MIVDILLVLIAIVATHYIAKASKAAVQVRRDVTATRALVDTEAEVVREEVAALRIKAKEVLQLSARTVAQSKRVLESTHEQKKNIDLLLGDERIQVILSKTRRET